MVEVVSDIVQLFDESGMEVAYGTAVEMRTHLAKSRNLIVDVYVGATQSIVPVAEFLEGRR
jgi:hypothetical protein